MDENEKPKYRRRKEKNIRAKYPVQRPIPNKIASFKFPAQVSPALREKYKTRKVQLINKQKLVNRLTHNPADDFIGTLKIF